MTHFYGILLNQGVPENRGAELCARMAQAFDRETYETHPASATGRLCVGFAVPKKLAGRVASSDLLLQRDGITVFGDIKLYNGDAIRAGAKAKPDSDTSILHRFVRCGGDPARLNGDFAFGAYEHSTQKLTLMRDHIGNRILYYAQKPEGLIFSTRIHCFFRAGFDEKDVDPMALASYLAMYFPGAGKTYYPSIMELEPAHRLVARPDRAASQQCYWSLQRKADLNYTRDDDWIEHIREVFIRAVTSRMHDAEKPGVRLSGGLDSSAVAGVMCSVNPELDIRAFAYVPSGYCPALEDDDAPYLQAVSDKWRNLSVTKVMSDRFDLRSGARYWEDFAASPCVDPFQFAVDALAEAKIDDGVDVVLTGEGGDDGLSGYPNTLLIESLLALRFGDACREFWRLKTACNSSLQKIIRAYLVPSLVPPSMKNAYRSMAGRPWHNDLALNHGFIENRDFLSHLASNGFPYLVAAPLNMREQIRRSFTPALSPLVAFGDRYTGSRGFQVRNPMHDKDLLQSVCSAPPTLMVTQHHDRALIRAVAQPFLPDNVRERAGKAPFVPDFFAKYETIIPELRDGFAAFGDSALWNSICDVRKAESTLERFGRDTIDDDDFDHAIHLVMMPYYLGCFLHTRGL